MNSDEIRFMLSQMTDKELDYELQCLRELGSIGLQLSYSPEYVTLVAKEKRGRELEKSLNK